MRRVILAVVSTTAALVLILSFKTHGTGSLATPPAAVSSTSSTPSSSSSTTTTSSKTVTGDAVDTRFGPVQVKVTITNGSYGVEITGVDSNTHGDLAINEAAGWGHTLDWAVDDGNEINENATGNGFVAVDAQGASHAVDQNWINATDVLKNPSLAQSGPGAGNPQHQIANAYKEAFRILEGLVSIVFHGHFGGNGGEHAHPDHGNTVRPIRFEPWLGGGVFTHVDVNVNVDISLKLGRLFV